MVISALRDLGVKAAADSLLDLLRETTDGNLLTAICGAIGLLGLFEAEPSLLHLLDDQRPGVRRARNSNCWRTRTPRRASGCGARGSAVTQSREHSAVAGHFS